MAGDSVTIKKTHALVASGFIASVALTAFITHEMSKPDEYATRRDSEFQQMRLSECQRSERKAREQTSGLVFCLSQAATLRDAKGCVAKEVEGMGIDAHDGSPYITEPTGDGQ